MRVLLSALAGAVALLAGGCPDETASRSFDAAPEVAANDAPQPDLVPDLPLQDIAPDQSSVDLGADDAREDLPLDAPADVPDPSDAGAEDGSPDVPPGPQEVTSALEWLGNPTAELYSGALSYARNPWDMLGFDGRLFIGSGNSSNEGPASNAGPVPVIAWDPWLEAFVEEYTVEDEQIDELVVLEGSLVIPGHDPLESWVAGNFYRRLAQDSWEKVRTIPAAIHNYSMTEHGNRIFAGLGTAVGSVVVASQDGGESWMSYVSHGYRTHAFLKVGDQLFAANTANVLTPEWDLVSEYAGFEAGFAERADLDVPTMLPDVWIDDPLEVRLARPVSFQGVALYIGARIHNDHQYLPLGLFAASSLTAGAVSVKLVELDPAGGLPWDLWLHDGRAWALVNRRIGDEWRVSIHAAEAPDAWSERVWMTLPTMARSAAFLEGDLYLGLGSEIEDPDYWDPSEILSETGDILRLPGIWLDG